MIISLMRDVPDHHPTYRTDTRATTRSHKKTVAEETNMSVPKKMLSLLLKAKAATVCLGLAKQENALKK